jgi:hypothetical protein
MIRGLLFTWAILAIAIALVAGLMDSVDIDGGVLGAILAGTKGFGVSVR